MNIQNQVCSGEQMAELTKLGIDTSKASMCWLYYNYGTGEEGDNEWILSTYNKSYYGTAKGVLPTFTAEDLITLISKITGVVEINVRCLYQFYYCHLEHVLTTIDSKGEKLIDCLFDILIELKKWDK